MSVGASFGSSDYIRMASFKKALHAHEASSFALGIVLIAVFSYLAFALPSITYVSPTLSGNATTGSNWVFVNMTSDEGLNQSFLEWGNQSGFANISMSNQSASMQNWYKNMTGLADGAYNYTIWAENTTGSWNQTGRRMVTVDTVKPTITIQSPTNTTYATATVDFNVTLNEVGSWAGYSLDSGANVTLTNSTGNWNGQNASMSQGQHNVRFFANDTAGNMNQSALLYFFVDSVNPSVSITTPASDGLWYNIAPSLTASCTDTNFVNMTINHTSYTATKTATPSTWTNTSALTQGENSFRITCTDVSGNTGTADRSFNFDSVIPNITFVYPTNNSGVTLSHNWTYVNVSISDATSPNNLTAFIDFNRSLVGWWRFNREAGENDTLVRDWSGYGNNGTMTNMNPGIDNGTSGWTTQGKFGNGIMFEPVTDSVDYIEIGTKSLLSNSTSVSISAWVKPRNNADFPRIFTHGTNNGYLLRIESVPSGNLMMLVNVLDGNNSGEVEGGTVYNDQWSFVSGVYDGTSGNTSVYINGIRVASSVCSNCIGKQVKDIPDYNRIGAESITNSRFNGSIDEVRIYNRALSSEEINASYNAGSYRLYHNFTALANGVYNYTAYVQDLAGNVNQTEERTVTIDTILPYVQISLPANTTYASTARTLNYTATDTNIDDIWYQYNGVNTTLSGNTTFTALNNQQSTLTLFANDSAGNINSTSVIFTVDTASPTITIQSPTNATYATTSVYFNITANENLNWSGYSLDGGTNVTLTNSTGIWWNLNSSMSQGYHTVVFYANDSVGNVGNSSAIGFRVDTVAPALVLDLPDNTTYNSVNRTLNYTATDTNSGINTTWYNYNGTNTTVTGNVSFTALSDKASTLTLFINDSAGNVNSTSVAFTVDTAAPIVALIGPASAYNTSSLSMSFSFNATDNINASMSCSLYVNGTSMATNSSTPNATAATFAGIGVSAGLNQNWTVSCTDGVNSNTPANRTFNVDNVVPTSNAPPNDSYVQGTSQTIGWLLYDNYAPGYYTVYRNGTVHNQSTWANNTNLSIGVNTSTVGSWNYTITYNDSVGNAGAADEVLITITSSDTTAPAITIQSPTNTSYGMNSIWFNITLDENGSWAGYSLDGAANVSLANSTGNWNKLSTVAEGLHNVTFYANDTLGNTNFTTQYFTINGLNACGNLIRAGTYYTLTQSVSSAGTCFNVLANNITLDGAGYTVNYSQSVSGSAINISQHNYTTIKNVNIFQQNASVEGASAILFSWAIGSTVLNNTIMTSGRWGVGIYASSGNSSVISNNTITTSGNNSDGIISAGSSSNLIFGNNISTTGSAARGVLFVFSSSSNITINNITAGGAYGIGVHLLDSSSSNMVLTNAIAALSTDGEGVRISSSSNSNILTNNTVLNSGSAGTGIYIYSSGANSITGGSVVSQAGNDYFLENASTTNNFTSTNFTARRIYFYDASSYFNYNNGSGNIWLRTAVSEAHGINRTLVAWSQSTMKWNDTTNGTGNVIANYTLSGLFANTQYKVYNKSAGTQANPYNITTDSGGVLSFNISLNGNTEIVVNTTTKPIVSLGSPPSSLVTNNATQLFNCSAESSGAIFVNITLYGNWSGWGAKNSTNITGTGNSSQWVNTLADGSYAWNCLAYDSTGNSSFAQSNYTLTIDTLPPMSIANLSNRSRSDSWIYWNWTNPVSDFNYSSVYLNGTWKANTSNNYYNATGLNASTWHEISVRTVDAAGNVNSTPVNSSAQTSADITPPAISSISSSVATTSATITWTTNEPSNSTVYYGTTTNATSTAMNTTLLAFHSISLSSLSSSTLYYYNISSCDSLGNCAGSGQYNFTTSVAQVYYPSPPSGGGGGSAPPAPVQNTTPNLTAVAVPAQNTTEITPPPAATPPPQEPELSTRAKEKIEEVKAKLRADDSEAKEKIEAAERAYAAGDYQGAYDMALAAESTIMQEAPETGIITQYAKIIVPAVLVPALAYCLYRRRDYLKKLYSGLGKGAGGGAKLKPVIMQPPPAQLVRQYDSSGLPNILPKPTAGSKAQEASAPRPPGSFLPKLFTPRPKISDSDAETLAPATTSRDFEKDMAEIDRILNGLKKKK